MEREQIQPADETLGSTADIARQDDIERGGGSGDTNAVGDAVQAGVAATPAADEPIMRDHSDLEESGGSDAAPDVTLDDGLPKMGVPS